MYCALLLYTSNLEAASTIVCLSVFDTVDVEIEAVRLVACSRICAPIVAGVRCAVVVNVGQNTLREATTTSCGIECRLTAKVEMPTTFELTIDKFCNTLPNVGCGNFPTCRLWWALICNLTEALR